MEGEEIGDPEADEERQHPDDDGVFQRVEIGLPRHPGAERVSIIGEDEIRIEAGEVVVPETDDGDHQDRRQEKRAEDQGKWRRLEIGGPSRQEARGAAGGRGGGGTGDRVVYGGCHLRPLAAEQETPPSRHSGKAAVACVRRR
jgi:hypothetical protein